MTSDKEQPRKLQTILIKRFFVNDEKLLAEMREKQRQARKSKKGGKGGKGGGKGGAKRTKKSRVRYLMKSQLEGMSLASS